MPDKTKPLVSIGVPVFNGETGLARALDSLLKQDYPNLEIIISDNGSTDATCTIGQTYAARDSRVKYFRSDENRGAIWNFNRVFELSTGEYFMWAAHDDQREPSCVSACLEKMEASPNAVLCQAHTAMFIEGRKELLCLANLNSYDSVAGVAGRYRETLERFPATAMYGLYRVSAVCRTKLLQHCIATDLAFIQELSIYGDFAQVPQVLFRYVGRPKWNTVDQDYNFFFGRGKKPWWYSPFLALFWNHFRRIASAEIPSNVKLRLWTILTRHHIAQAAFKLVLKASGRLCPEPTKENLARDIYCRWMLSPNVEIGDEGLFLERVIKPSVGWWR